MLDLVAARHCRNGFHFVYSECYSMSYESTRTVSRLRSDDAVWPKWLLSIMSIVLTATLVVVLHSGI